MTGLELREQTNLLFLFLDNPDSFTSEELDLLEEVRVSLYGLVVSLESAIAREKRRR
jgi:hypothetical protein